MAPEGEQGTAWQPVPGPGRLSGAVRRRPPTPPSAPETCGGKTARCCIKQQVRPRRVLRLRRCPTTGDLAGTGGGSASGGLCRAARERQGLSRSTSRWTVGLHMKRRGRVKVYMLGSARAAAARGPSHRGAACPPRRRRAAPWSSASSGRPPDYPDRVQRRLALPLRRCSSARPCCSRAFAQVTWVTGGPPTQRAPTRNLPPQQARESCIYWPEYLS